MKTAQADARESTVMIGGQVSGAGAVTVGTAFQVTKTGTGSYTVRVPGLKYIRSAVAQTAVGTFMPAVSFTQPDVVGVQTYNASAALADIAFYLTIMGAPR